MKYIGTFKNIKGETVEVVIVSNNNSSETTEITLAGESPVIISQTSSDGIFSPIKSRSCTITFVSENTYFDMYSGSSHGTQITVKNTTRGECLFYGYLTPCQYNQPYVYLNEIELEAVDAVSTLQDFKYEKQGTTSSIVSIQSIIQNALNNVAGYKGGIYIPKLGLRMKSSWDSSIYPTEKEFISESAFFDDDDEAMSYYEVLEEICKFYNMTLVPVGNDVFFLDYEVISKYGISYSWLTQDNNYQTWKNILNNYQKQILIPKYITKDDYCGDEQNIELDSVYNKVKVEAETKEVDEIIYDPMEDASSSNYYNTYNNTMQRTDGETWTSTNRVFQYDKEDGEYGWRTLLNVNSTTDTSGYVLTYNFDNIQKSITQANSVFPYYSGYIFNHIPGQTCLPVQQFYYHSTLEMPYSADWNNYLMFFPQAQWIDTYLRQNSITVPFDITDTDAAKNYWEDTFYEEHMGGSNPVLQYKDDKEIEYSPSDSSKTNYLAFTGDILWQRDVNYDSVNYHLWTEEIDESNDKYYYGCSMFQMKDMGASATDNAYTRTKSESGYNEGWNMLKMKIQIGNRYWNGINWQADETTCWIPYHKENVVSDDECLIWSDYNKPVTNHNYTYKIGKEAYVIPITKDDGLQGRLSVDIYMPKIPYNSTFTLGSTSDFNLRVNYTKTPPIIFMKNLSLELISTDNNTESWYTDLSDLKDDDDDITYENTISDNNVEEFDDLSLKINTYNEKKPISESYILELEEYEERGDYLIASTDFEPYTPTLFTWAEDGQQYAMYTIKLTDWGSDLTELLSWFYSAVYTGQVENTGAGATVRIFVKEIGWRTGYLTINGDNIILRVGTKYSTVEAAQASDGEILYNYALNSGIGILFNVSSSVYPPKDVYPEGARKYHNSSVKNINKALYHTDGFYRPLTNTTKREEMNIVDRYVEHYTNPKKIYNCQVHGYCLPWKCVMPSALDNIKMVVDEQEYDVKADTNSLKLIEY